MVVGLLSDNPDWQPTGVSRSVLRTCETVINIIGGKQSSECPTRTLIQ